MLPLLVVVLRSVQRHELALRGGGGEAFDHYNFCARYWVLPGLVAFSQSIEWRVFLLFGWMFVSHTLFWWWYWLHMLVLYHYPLAYIVAWLASIVGCYVATRIPIILQQS